MLNIISQQGKVNQNHSEIPPRVHRDGQTHNARRQVLGGCGPAECEVVRSLWKTVAQFLQVLNIQLQRGPRHLPKRNEEYAHTKTCI